MLPIAWGACRQLSFVLVGSNCWCVHTAVRTLNVRRKSNPRAIESPAGRDCERRGYRIRLSTPTPQAEACRRTPIGPDGSLQTRQQLCNNSNKHRPLTGPRLENDPSDSQLCLNTSTPAFKMRWNSRSAAATPPAPQDPDLLPHDSTTSLPPSAPPSPVPAAAAAAKAALALDEVVDVAVLAATVVPLPPLPAPAPAISQPWGWATRAILVDPGEAKWGMGGRGDCARVSVSCVLCPSGSRSNFCGFDTRL